MLEGNLDEFSLPDIFQLLSLTKKSGALRVSGDGAEGRVFFKHGEVYYAVSDARRMTLGARLVGAGLVREEQLQRVLDSGRAGGSAQLGQLLLEENTIDDAVLDTLVREQIQDAVFELMRLPAGRFKFDPAEDADIAVGLTVAADQLVMEGSRRLGEWASVVQQIPSRDAVIAMTPLPRVAGQQITLTVDQWRLLALVDGQRTVGEVVDLTGQGEYATCLVLCALVESGLVDVQDPGAGGETALAALVRRREALRRLEELDSEERSGGPGSDAAEPQAPASQPAAPAPAPVPVRQPVAAPSPSFASRPGAPADDTRVDDVIAGGVAADDVAADDVAADDVAVFAGLGDETTAPAPGATTPSVTKPVTQAGSARTLTRDQDVNKGLLLRLIDGVKGA